ncbi:MAG: phosphonate lyase system protein PhnH [Herminiimonas sp.]|nr:phosphonate lyase system protein PhnH [Herminiimonas sp.]
MNAAAGNTLLPAWSDSVHDAQAAFRCILQALSEPGLIRTLPVTVAGPAPLDAATTALCLALADHETPVWLAEHAGVPAVQSYLRFHCGCPLTSDPAAAAFAVITDPEQGIALDRFAQGVIEYPDRSTTLLIQVPILKNGPVRLLSGPGIPQTRAMRIGGLPDDFDALWRANTSAFPLGVDVVFCCGNDIVGLPRTTHIHV